MSVSALILGILGIVSAHYEDPYKHRCAKDEQAIQVQGVIGEFCSPECFSNNSCPTDVPSGVTATPDCAISSSTGSKYCALICTPNATDSGDSQCGTDASCKAISGTGLCTYDDGPPPPSSEHWEVVRSGSFEEMTVAVSLTFFNDMVGWVGGGDNEVGALIKKTVDGGVTWKETYPGDGEPKFDIFLSAAAKSLNNVIVGGALFQVYSTDGTFFNASIDDFVTPSQDAEIIPGGEFVLIGENGKCNGVATSMLGKIWKCMDIGVNSTLFPVRYGSFPTKNTWYVTSGEWPDEASNSQFRSISQKIRLNKKTGKLNFSSRSRTETSSAPDYTALISKTTDAGATWSIVFQNETDYYFNDISCWSADHCVAVAEGDSCHIFLTMDGGKTWEETLFDPDSQSSLMRVAMVSETEVWATGGHMASFSFHGRFYHSIDGGRSWKLEFIKGLYIIDVDMIDATHGFGIGLTISTGLELIKYRTNSTPTNEYKFNKILN